MGVLRQASGEFEPAADVSLGGVLWALPALRAEGLLRHSRKLFALPEGFYPLETIFLVLAFMALVRVRSLEALRYEPPGEWGQLVGLDRIPEVRTLRQKLGQLGQPPGVATTWSSQLAREWMARPAGPRRRLLRRRPRAGLSRETGRAAPPLRGPAEAVSARHH